MDHPIPFLRDDPVTFRRAGIERALGLVFVEVSLPRNRVVRYYLQGKYDVDKTLAKVIGRRYVFLDHWVEANKLERVK